MTTIFEQKNSFKVYLQIALPLVASSLVTMLYNIADTYFISYEQDAVLVAGVSLCAPVLTILMALGNLLAQGGSSLFSRLLGAGDHEKMKSISSFCFYSSLLIGFLVALILMLFTDPLLGLMGADSDTMEAASAYYRTIVLASPLIILSFIPTNMLRAEGLSRESMLASIIGTGINLILDPIFILYLHWGAFGAAFATVFGYIGTDLFCLLVILKKSRSFSVNIRLCRCSSADVRGIISIGISSALTNILMSVSQMMVNQAYLAYGNDKIAALGIASKIYYVPFMILIGFSFGAQPILGYFCGSGNKEKLSRIFRQIMVFSFVLALIFTVLLIATASLTVPCFLKDTEIVSAGISMLFWQSLMLPMTALLLDITILLQAMGRALPALILSLTRQGILFIAILWISELLWGYDGILRTPAISDLLSGICALLILLYVRKKPGDPAVKKTVSPM